MTGASVRRLVLAGSATLLVLAAATTAIVILFSYLNQTHLRHQRHDPLLGWTHIPGTLIPDMYGPGRSLRINSQSFRNDEEFSRKTPPGKVRVVCSGDSMTFGFGVDNGHTWSQELSALDPRLQTINMGQIGYGLDQMYLWYMRAGLPLKPDIHILALSGVAMGRLARTGRWRRPRPELQWVEGRLVVRNFPVPAPAGWRQWVPLELLLKSPRILGLRRKTEGDRARDEALAAHILDSLDQQGRTLNPPLMIAYLPTLEEVESGRTGPWPLFLSSESRRRGLLFKDLTEDLRRLPPAQRRRLFLRREFSHYNEEGNRLVAAALYMRLRADPRTARWIAPARDRRP